MVQSQPPLALPGNNTACLDPGEGRPAVAEWPEASVPEPYPEADRQAIAPFTHQDKQTFPYPAHRTAEEGVLALEEKTVSAKAAYAGLSIPKANQLEAAAAARRSAQEARVRARVWAKIEAAAVSYCVPVHAYLSYFGE